MTDYRNFTAEDFSKDELFISWVKNPESDSALFWNSWIEKNPDKRHVLDRAKALVIAFEELYGDNLSAEEIVQEINLLKLKAEFADKPRSYTYFIKQFYQVAATILLISGLSYLVYQYIDSNNNIPEFSEKTTEKENNTGPFWITKVNNESKPQTILLTDGSEVVLGENSSLRYLSDYKHSDARTVYLTGEAFFEVAKDSLHPFLVFAGKTVTRVLGTSFRVQSADDKVEVRVNSGKVAVHRLSDFELHTADKSSNIPGVILSPNHKAVFETALESFNTSKLKLDDKTIIPRTNFETDFNDIPVTEVLDSLSSSYDVPINYDSADLSQCHINTMFKDESLLQKIKLVCIAIGADYHISNGSIFIGNAKCN